MSDCASGCAEVPTGNDIPLMHEIRHALTALLESGETTIIDLRALPLAPGEEDHIEAMLGKGEVSATLDALGPTEILETGISGVWLVTHYNTNEEILGKFIEIARFPSILESQAEDIQAGMDALDSLLAEHL